MDGGAGYRLQEDGRTAGKHQGNHRPERGTRLAHLRPHFPQHWMHGQCSPTHIHAYLRGQCRRLPKCALPQREGNRSISRPQARGLRGNQAHPQRGRSHPHGQSERRTQPDSLLRGLRVQAEHETAIQRANDHLQARCERVLAQARTGRVHPHRLRRNLGKIRTKQPRTHRRSADSPHPKTGRERGAIEAVGPTAGDRS